MDTDATRRLIEELLEAYNAPDLDRAALLYAEDCEYVNRAYGIEAKGRDEQRANMQAFLHLFPDRTLRPRRLLADEGGAALEAEFVATSPGGRGCHRPDSPTPARCAACSRSGTGSLLGSTIISTVLRPTPRDPAAGGAGSSSVPLPLPLFTQVRGRSVLRSLYPSL